MNGAFGNVVSLHSSAPGASQLTPTSFRLPQPQPQPYSQSHLQMSAAQPRQRFPASVQGSGAPAHLPAIAGVTAKTDYQPHHHTVPAYNTYSLPATAADVNAIHAHNIDSGVDVGAG